MRKLLYIIPFILGGCIGEDIEFDSVDPVVRITNPITSLEIGTFYQFEYMFLDNVGASATPTVEIWTSSDESVANVDDTGLVLGLANGTVTISVSASLEMLEADTSITFVVSGDPTMLMDVQRSGTVQTTSSYVLEGDFTLTISGTDDLELALASNYVADTGLPGLYVYLSNNPNSIAEAHEIGRVNTFSGAHSYIIEDAGLLDYDYVLYFCKPFNVKVGHGNIE